MKILHVITGLEDGGAEAVLYRLCAYDRSAKHVVVSLMGPGKYGPMLKERGTQVYALSMRRRRVTLAGAFRLLSIIREVRPDTLQTWMYHANFLGGLASMFIGNVDLFWNIRHSDLDRSTTSRSTIVLARILAALSRWMPRLRQIIYCAQMARLSHEEKGFNKSKGVVVPNGYDLGLFTASDHLRQSVRHELGISDATRVIGMVARWHPDKDHRTLFESVRSLLREFGDSRVVLVGTGMSPVNTELVELLEEFGIRDSFLLLGRRNDMPAVMNAIDIHVLSSSTEAFPNVLAEAMACGTPCVSTNVGDASEILGDTGWLVPRRDPAALSTALVAAVASIGTPRFAARKVEARRRVVENFGLQTMIDSYHVVWSAR